MGISDEPRSLDFNQALLCFPNLYDQKFLDFTVDDKSSTIYEVISPAFKISSPYTVAQNISFTIILVFLGRGDVEEKENRENKENKIENVCLVHAMKRSCRASDNLERRKSVIFRFHYFVGFLSGQ